MGKFIVIDGLDGSGKETQTLLLQKSLEAKGLKTRVLSFPMYQTTGATLVEAYLSGTFGQDPEAVNAYAASTFFAMDRFFSYRTDWKKDIDDANTVVLANRYTSANAVHQLSKLPCDQWDSFLKWLEEYEFSLLQLPRPDSVVYLEVTPEISHRLIDARSAQTGRKQDIHEKDPHHLENSYQAAVYASNALGWHRICCYEKDALRSREAIQADILTALGY